MTVTKQLKAELWKRFGSQNHPSEWDGNVYGGGKLSQRFWEYFIGVELLEIDSNSVVLDIGGGSPVTGMGFFSSLLSTAAKKVIILDPNIGNTEAAPKNLEFVKRNASYDELKSVFVDYPEITHVSSISVFEHIPPPIREGMVTAINEFFRGRSFVATFEFHPKKMFFKHQLNARTTSSLFKPLTNFYLDEFRASPVGGENSIDQKLTVKIGRGSPIAPTQTPLWHPVAVRFLPLGGEAAGETTEKS
jgi:hypothetical protein